MSFYLKKTGFINKPWGLPFSLSIEPTTACNLQCPECPSGLRAFTRPTGNLKADFFSKILQDISQRLWVIQFYFQGEPYINPEFLNMVAAAKSKRLYTMTSTNGHFLDRENSIKTIQSGLDRLIVSVDGATQEVYEQYRIGGKLQTVIDGLETLVSCKKELNSKHPYIVLQVLVVRPNEHQLEALKALAEQIGVDEIKYKTAQVYDYENGNPLIPQNTKFARYRQEADGKWAAKHSLTPWCWKMWHSAVITWDGTVVPCCFDKDATHAMGSLRSDAFKTVWESKTYRQFRSKLAQGRDQIDICTNCSEGCSVFTG